MQKWKPERELEWGGGGGLPLFEIESSRLFKAPEREFVAVMLSVFIDS